MPVRYIQQPKHFDLYVSDGSGTPNYVKFFHYTMPDLPGREDRTETEIELDGGRASDNMAVYTPDETAPFRPVPFDLEIAMLSDAYELADAFGNFFNKSPWTIGGDTWTAVADSAIGTRKNSSGDDVACIAPNDSVLLSKMFNMHGHHVAHPSVSGGDDFIMQYLGCVASSVIIGPSGPLLKFKVSGMIYGAIGKVANLPAGWNESIPS